MKLAARHRPVSGRRVDPIAIVTAICRHAGDRFYLTKIRRESRRSGIVAAVAARDNRALYAWFMETFNYQGVSNAAAQGFLERHGSIEYEDVETALANAVRLCPKLVAFEAMRGCGYQKLAQTCNNPAAFSRCPLPEHMLRKGQLNQAAYSLYLFIRDRAQGDLVGFIDRVLKDADRPGHPDRLAFMRSALVDGMLAINGVSSKMLNMTLASVLLGGDRKRARWIETGATMIAIDRLVHNFFGRTGIHHRFGIRHRYGSACYGPNGCEGILDRLAREIDARQFNPSFPSYFPRFVQSAIWRFCSEAELAICNGQRIDDRERCPQRDCSAFAICGRIALR